MALIIGVVIVLLILFGFLCYKKAPPTEAIVVTGFGLARPKVVCGKGTFVLPVLQRADRLNMRLLKIDVKTPETGVKPRTAYRSGLILLSRFKSTVKILLFWTRKSRHPV